MVRFFRYALRKGREEYIIPAVRIAYATDGGISYTEAKNMGIWELSVVSNELERLSNEAKRKSR